MSCLEIRRGGRAFGAAVTDDRKFCLGGTAEILTQTARGRGNARADEFAPPARAVLNSSHAPPQREAHADAFGK